METKFVAEQRRLRLSECERLCGRRSGEVGELAARAGGSGILEAGFSVPIHTALNMLVLSIGQRNGVEFQDMAARLPGLREEALLYLGLDTANWSFEGPPDAEGQFWPMLYGTADVVRPRIVRMLGCYSHRQTRQLRFFSPNDVEEIADYEFGQVGSDRAARFTIDAHDIARQVEAVCGSPLFTVTVATL